MLLEHRESRSAPKKVLKARTCDVCFNVARRQERAASKEGVVVPMPRMPGEHAASQNLAALVYVQRPSLPTFCIHTAAH